MKAHVKYAVQFRPKQREQVLNMEQHQQTRKCQNKWQQKQKDEGEGNVTLTMQEAEALANAVFNNDIEKAKKILSSVMNIQEETGPAPPQA